MRLFAAAALAAIALIAAPALADNPPAKAPDQTKPGGAKELIVGKWQPADAKDKAVLEFLKDGKIKISSDDFAIDGTYKFLDDTTVEAKLSFAGKDNTVKLKVTVTKDELKTQEDGKKNTETFKRVTK